MHFFFHCLAVKWVFQERQKAPSFHRSHVRLYSLDQRELEVGGNKINDIHCTPLHDIDLTHYLSTVDL